MTPEQHDLCKSIIQEMVAVSNDPEFSESFRDEIRTELSEIKEDLEKAVIQYA